ncbi:putative polygalacturonase [Auxenochlorella protothecoides]|uniref:Putative polygalacturonase n=1 Tax=Auxenochlorella protothecoides TaxID=3075 RepID=A0A087SUF0_AUXPR|nr:putative polygalacturonase [Auxenochlorella protothecoides]KFM29354.1 putative polygalacturonase [Auxenochlorella protothecoides]
MARDLGSDAAPREVPLRGWTTVPKGGQLVLDRPGTFLAGGLVAHGSIDIVIPRGVRLLASHKRSDYGPTQPDWYLIALRNCTGCSLRGGGTLDGDARAWDKVRAPGRRALVDWADPSCPVPSECRPRLLGVLDSRQVSVRGLALRDPVYWALHVRHSVHVALDGLDIHSEWGVANADGVDVDGSWDVDVRGCTVLTADDAVCLKACTPGRPTRRVSVTNCTLRSRSAAVKVGSETRADISDVTFGDLTILPSHRGLAIQLRDEGSVERIAFRDIGLHARHYHPSWWGGGEALHVTAVPRVAGGPLGRVRGVSVERVQARSETGVFVAGRVSDLRISQAHLTMAWRSGWPYAGLDFRPSDRGVVPGTTSHALFVTEGAAVAVRDSAVEYLRPLRPDWGSPLLQSQGGRSELQDVHVTGWCDAPSLLTTVNGDAV